MAVSHPAGPPPSPAQAEDMFYRAFHLSPDAININRLDDGLYLDVNAGFTTIMGYTRAEVLGRASTAPGLELWAHPEDRERLVAGLRATGEVVGLEAQFRRKDGKLLYGLMSARLMEVGGVPCILSITRDIDGRKRAETALRESSQLNLQIIQSAREGIVVYGKDLRYEVWNPYMEALTGKPASEVLGRLPLEAFPFLQGTGVLEGLERSLAGDPGETLEFQVQLPGRLAWMLHTSVPLRDAAGEITGVIATVLETTEHHLAEDALRASETKYRLLVEHSHDIIYTLTPDGVITFLSPSWVHHLGLPVEAALGQSFVPLIHPEDLDRCNQALATALTGAEDVPEVAYRVRHGDGTWRWFTAKVCPLQDRHGAVVGLQGSARDITEWKETEEARQALEAHLHQAQKMESLGSLAGGVAHDMNNVLGAILAVTQTLKLMYGGESHLGQALGTIEKASTRGRDLVRTLTNFARKELREPAPMDLNELVREEIELLRRTTLQKVALVMDLDYGLAPVLGERSSLGSSLMNLCVNAVDAMPQGGTLTLRTRSLPGQVEVAVQDTGEGMTPAVLARAMEPFFTTKPVGKGTGLGLAMVFAAVKAHGGQVHLQSEPGQGTTVTLRLPALAVSDAPAAVAARTARAERALAVLLVDDDELIRAALPPLVTSLGHRVATAPGGREALAWLAQGHPCDLMILDLNMPGMNGAETLQRLRQDWPTLPVLLATGNLDDETALRLFEDGRAGCILKPFDLGELDRKIQELMG